MALAYLTLIDLERSKSKPVRCRNPISCKGAELGHMLLLNINRKASIGAVTSHLNVLERSMPRSLIL